MTRNIILTGFMGAGKSLIAKMLSAKLKRRVVSTDELIVQKEKRPINEIFRDSGEEYFRQVEATIVEQVSQQEGLIIDCGGGIVLRDRNMTVLRKNGIIIYLHATPTVIYNRVKLQKHRPLLNCENPRKKIEVLLQERLPTYNKADVIIDTSDKTPDQVCDEIIRVVNND